MKTSDPAYLDQILYEVGGGLARAAAELTRGGWGALAADAKSLAKRVDEFRFEISEAFDKQQPEQPTTEAAP